MVPLKLKEQWVIRKHEKRPHFVGKKFVLALQRSFMFLRVNVLENFRGGKKPSSSYKMSLLVLLLRRTICRVVGVDKRSLD